MAGETRDFLKNLPRDTARILRPEEEDRVAGRVAEIHARNAIIVSAIALCPLTALFVSIGFLANAKLEGVPDLLFGACLVYPLVGLIAVVLGLAAHSHRHFALAQGIAKVLPILNIGVILDGFVWWGFS